MTSMAQTTLFSLATTGWAPINATVLAGLADEGVGDFAARLDKQGDRSDFFYDCHGLQWCRDSHATPVELSRSIESHLAGLSPPQRHAVQIAAASVLVNRKKNDILNLLPDEKTILGLVGDPAKTGLCDSLLGRSKVGLAAEEEIATNLNAARLAKHLPSFITYSKWVEPMGALWHRWRANVAWQRAEAAKTNDEFLRWAERRVEAARHWSLAGYWIPAGQLCFEAGEFYLGKSHQAQDEEKGIRFRFSAEDVFAKSGAYFLEAGQYAHAADAFFRGKKYGEAGLAAHRALHLPQEAVLGPEVARTLMRWGFEKGPRGDPMRARLLATLQSSYASSLRGSEYYFWSALHYLDAAANFTVIGAVKEAGEAFEAAASIAAHRLGMQEFLGTKLVSL